MHSFVKFYARNSRMKGINISGGGQHIFDSDFFNAEIKDSVFNMTDFTNCDLGYARFYNVSFKECFLYRLITDRNDFINCDFTRAYMDDFIFDNCVFRRCDFTRCNMRNVTFKVCRFIDCDFKDAALPPFFNPCQMTDCKNIPYMPMACPEEGEFIGYKIASDDQICARVQSFIYENKAPANVLVTLKIPADAKRSSAGGRKCRCDKATVIGLEHVVTHENLSVAYSKHDGRFEYHIGKEISVPDFNENRWDECSEGIHFFINRKEALQYYYLMEVYYGRKQC